MGIDLALLSESYGAVCTPTRYWLFDSHNVALIFMAYKYPDSQPKLFEDLVCDCDCRVAKLRKENKTVTYTNDNDPERCGYKKIVRRQVINEAREKYGWYWEDLGMKNAVLDIYKRVQEQEEWLGQCSFEMIYVQEVAEILRVKNTVVLKACGQLYEEKKLSLNGMILTDWVSPQEELDPIKISKIVDTKSAIEALANEHCEIFRHKDGWQYRRFVPTGETDRKILVGGVEHSMPYPTHKMIVLAEAATLVELARKVIGGEKS